MLYDYLPESCLWKGNVLLHFTFYICRFKPYTYKRDCPLTAQKVVLCILAVGLCSNSPSFHCMGQTRMKAGEWLERRYNNWSKAHHWCKNKRVFNFFITLINSVSLAIQIGLKSIGIFCDCVLVCIELVTIIELITIKILCKTTLTVIMIFEQQFMQATLSKTPENLHYYYFSSSALEDYKELHFISCFTRNLSDLSRNHRKHLK